MRTFRIVVLVLLAALLPWRGALAEAVACSGAHHGAAAAGAAHHHHGAQGQEPASHHADEATDATHAGHADEARAQASPTGDCHLCASCCTSTPLISVLPALLEPHGFAELRFAALEVPTAAHLSGGRDRPPRTL